MRRRLFISFLFLLTLFGVSLSKLYSQTDPNANPNWDWRGGDDPAFTYPGTQYKVYLGSPVAPVFIKAPWSQFNAWDGLNDNQAADGWTLVARDFGTPTRAISTSSTPGVGYFLLYNKYRSLLRVFILVKASANFSSGAVIMQFGGATKTATLTHMQPRAYATDNLAAVQDNKGSALTNTVADGAWVWADFPMAFDNTIVGTTSPDCARLTFQVIGTTETSIQMSGQATGVGGTTKNVRDFMTGGLNGAVTASTAMPTTTGSGINFGSFQTKVLGTSTDWNKWKVALDDMYKNLGIHTEPDPLSIASNNLALAIGDLKNNWIVQNLPLVGAAYGLVDFLFGGGNSTDPAKVAPTFYAFNLNLTGTATTNYYLAAGATIPVPAAKSNPDVPCLGSSVPLIYNGPVGLVNLAKTPILKYKLYTQTYPWLPSSQNRQYWDFQVKEDLDLRVNPNAGLVLDSVRAWIVMDPSPNVNLGTPLSDADLKLLATWVLGSNPPPRAMELESTIGNKFVFRSKPVDGRAFRYQTMRGPDGKFISPGLLQTGFSPDMTVKIKAVLHRVDNPSAIPVVVILTYEPAFEDAGTGTFPAAPEPVLTDVKDNWNMLSVPNLSYNYATGLSDYSKGYVYPTSSTVAYKYTGSAYVSEDPLVNGRGYWLKFPTVQTVTNLGPSLKAITINVAAGWNLIGTITSALPTEKVKSFVGATETPGNVVSSYFRYTAGSGYLQSSVLQPGFGFWVKVTQAGTLVLDEAAIGTTPPPLTSEQPPPLFGAPSIPVLQAPVNGSSNVSIYPTLYWYTSSSALSYQFQVSTNSSFSSLVYDQGGVTSTYASIGALAYSTTYYWRVKAINDAGPSNWSDAFWFTTKPAPPPNPCDPASAMVQLDQFTVSDSRNHGQSLFVTNGGRKLDLGFQDFAIPPKSPAGLMKAQFKSGKFLLGVPPNQGRVKIPIEVDDAQMPITLNWNFRGQNNVRYWYTSSGSHPNTIELTSSGSLTVSSLQNGSLIIIAQAIDPCTPASEAAFRSADEEVASEVPHNYDLSQNYPNPFNPVTTIRYQLPEDGNVVLNVYNTVGQIVRTLVDQSESAGYKSVEFDGSNLPSGVYYYKLRVGSYSSVKKLLLMK